jgi:hypothetical protein
VALLAATLATEMDAEIGNVATEALARTAWAQAWRNYFAGALANGVPIAAAALDAGQSALASGLTGMSSSGASAIQTGLTAWWAALVPATAFTGATVITPPPGLTGVAAALAPVFVTNNAPGITKTQALTNLANALHAAAGIGGTATFPGPVVAPIL